MVPTSPVAGRGRLRALVGETFDVAIIGGGIIGCGIARDAALRGLHVALFDRADFGSGTTAASTRIVHGGLRYLEMLDFRLVRLDLRERETLLRIAPHLVRPLEFVIPFLRDAPVSPLKLRLGLLLYDALSFDRSLPAHRIIGRNDAARLDRALVGVPLRGAAAYFDARVDLPERLALENALDAEAHGARVFNYCTVVSAIVKNGSAAGVRVRDGLDGSEVDVAARLVVNATGAWWERVAAVQSGRRLNRIRTTKGVHIACPPLTDRALVLFSDVDRRLMFAIPRAGQTWIGTTDTDYDGDPADVRASRADVEYLLRSVRTLFPSLTISDVFHTTAGVRALVTRAGRASSISRMHKVVNDEAMPGVVSVLGGKITGYRAIAEDVTDAVCGRIGVARRSTTAITPLPGAREHAAPPAGPEDSPPMPEHLHALYGARAGAVMAIAREAESVAQPLSPRYPDIGAQVVFGVRTEHCVQLSDFIRRRTLLGAAPDQGWDAAPAAAALMATELGWSPAETAAQIEACRQDIERACAFKEDS